MRTRWMRCEDSFVLYKNRIAQNVAARLTVKMLWFV